MQTKKLAIAAGCFAGLLALSNAGAMADPKPPRKVEERVSPRYPELAKRMHITGSVRVEVVVHPNGSVKSTRTMGGSPVLAQSAIEAVQHWKFEASQNETTEVVVLTFQGQ